MSAIDNKQLKAAQAEAATATDTYTHVFKKPFTYEDKTYEQLTLDFGSLTGRDFMAIDREVREREGRVPIVPVYDTSFLMRIHGAGPDRVREMALGNQEYGHQDEAHRQGRNMDALHRQCDLDGISGAVRRAENELPCERPAGR